MNSFKGFSKVTNKKCMIQLSLPSPHLALYNLIRNRYSILCKKSLKNTQYRSINYNYALYKFCSQHNKKESDNVTSDTTKSQEEQEELESKYKHWAPQFVKYIEQNNTNHNNYVYTNKVIYEQTTEGNLRDKAISFFFKSNLWGAITYATFTYLNQWAALIPLIPFINSILAIFVSRRFGVVSITSMELVDPKHVKLRFLWGNNVIVKIEDFEYLFSRDISAEFPPPVTKGNKIHVLFANFRDTKGKVYWEMKFLIDPLRTKVDNIDLFKAVITGKAAEIEKFRYT